jgi:hypothetical protein
VPVHFYVQRNKLFTTTNTPIPFDLEVVHDEKNAMDLASGIFTATRMGIYLFVEEANTIANQNDQLTLQSTLNLKKGDQVWVVIDPMSSGVSLYDSTAHYTHFTGFFWRRKLLRQFDDFVLMINYFRLLNEK